MIRTFARPLLQFPRRARICESSMAYITVLQTLLENESTDKYKIEYDGFLSNHMSHGIIALGRLGASNERLDKFVQWYAKKLELPTSADKSETLTPEKIQSLLGKEESFYALLNYYQGLLAGRHGGCVDKLIAEEFPKLSTGIAGAAFHGAIHLGYGYAARHERTIVEGLAYLHFAYRPVVAKKSKTWHEDIGNGERDIVDVLNAIAGNKPLITDMLAAEKNWIRNQKSTSTFQRKTDYLLTEKADALIDSARSIKFPDTVFENGKLNPIKLCQQILEWAITVYTISEAQNDFFLLHGVTCTWALCQILPVLKHGDAIRMLAELLVGIEATYLAQRTPELNHKPADVSGESWDEIIENILHKDLDEHIFKLVQVCHEQSIECGDSNPIFKQAALSCVHNDLRF